MPIEPDPLELDPADPELLEPVEPVLLDPVVPVEPPLDDPPEAEEPEPLPIDAFERMYLSARNSCSKTTNLNCWSRSNSPKSSPATRLQASRQRNVLAAPRAAATDVCPDDVPDEDPR